VANTVTSHQAFGLGIYCFFQANPSNQAAHAIETPTGAGIGFPRNGTVSLGGTGTIQHIIKQNGDGELRDHGPGSDHRSVGPGAFAAIGESAGVRHGFGRGAHPSRRPALNDRVQQCRDQLTCPRPLAGQSLATRGTSLRHGNALGTGAKPFPACRCTFIFGTEVSVIGNTFTRYSAIPVDR